MNEVPALYLRIQMHPLPFQDGHPQSTSQWRKAQYSHCNGVGDSRWVGPQTKPSLDFPD